MSTTVLRTCCCGLLVFHELQIDVIDRMPESLFRPIVFGLDFIAERRHLKPFAPDFPRCAPTQRPVRSVLIVVILPVTQSVERSGAFRSTVA